jgi:RHS repeat-associated protein
MIHFIPRKNQKHFAIWWIRIIFILFLIFCIYRASAQFHEPAPVRTPTNVAVNRQLPPGVLRPDQPLVFRFSINPTDDEIFRARSFEEPLLPAKENFIITNELASENKALVKALIHFTQRDSSDDFTAITSFMEAFPNSRWNGALNLNLGVLYRRTGYFSLALNCFENSWDILKKEKDYKIKVLGDRAAADLLAIYQWAGMSKNVEKILDEIKDRPINGPAVERILQSREAYDISTANPGHAFRCGIYALNHLFRLKKPIEDNSILREANSPMNGFSLSQIQEIASKAGLDYQMAFRKRGSVMIPDAIVHWRLNHFTNFVAIENGFYKCFDATYTHYQGNHIWMTANAFESESSGYFLIPNGTLPKGWRVVSQEEGSKIYGKCSTPASVTGITKNDITTCNGSNGTGMATASVHLASVSLYIVDVPLSYSPPIGNEIEIEVSYHQRDSYQPANFSYSNFGPKWTLNWISYVEDNPNIMGSNASVYLIGGGIRTFTDFNTNDQSYAPEVQTRDILKKISDDCYELNHPDGSKDIYARPDGTSGAGRKIFLTQTIDVTGNIVTINYDDSLRIMALQDALGQVTTFYYDLGDDRITKIADPFGRSCLFTYNANGYLLSITDVIGLVSQFEYGTGDFIDKMATPYGTTLFSKTEVGTLRVLDITYPLGEKERVEFKEDPLPVPDIEPVVPSGMTISNYDMNSETTYYWNKKAMREASGDYLKATMYRWLRGNTAIGNEDDYTSNFIHSVKKPFENRIWYNYEGQTISDAVNNEMSSSPSKIGRVLDDGTTQLTQFSYNILGGVTKSIDPLGREDTFIYAANNIDLLAARQTNGNLNEMLFKATYNDQHLPLTIKDASGQSTTFTYNTNGQPLTITNALGETTTLEYDGAGYLTNITGAIPGSTYSLTYDGYGRPRTITDPDNYTITYDYDAMDRPTLITYPDNTYEQIVYNKLDATDFRDRIGRWSHITYDSLQRVSIMEDALGRISQFIWCSCGSMSEIIDPLKNITLFTRDLQGRATSKTYADGSKVNYTYENTTSRLKKVTDAKGQETQYTYYLDDNIKQVDYLNATIATPSVSFNYDSIYNRLLSMTDGTGTTKYAYHPITTSSTLGAGMLASVDGPLDNDIITIAYDSLGRLSSRSINGVASSRVYDALSRITSNSNALGTFNYDYVNQTNRLSSVTYPSGQKTTYTYFNKYDDFLVKEILNKTQSGTTLSRFNYEYNDVDQITKWTQKSVGTEKYFDLSYDQADQLIAATQKKTSNNSLVKRFAYHYDPAGNRTTEQIDNALNSAIHNSLNQITTTSPGGEYRIKGSLSEFSKVSFSNSTNGAVDSATVDENNVFTGSINVVPGKNVISVTATDYSGNNNTTLFKTKPTITGGPVHTYTYDKNGNTLTDATDSVLITYGWDAADRLIKITRLNLVKLIKIKVTEFVYDGYGRRVAEKMQGVVIKRWVWCGMGLCEERDATGGNVTKRFFQQGEEINGVDYFFTKDHLGSIREMTNNSGTIVARYDYDPYGRRTKTEGTLEADFGFTGHYYHASSGLNLALFRAYNPIGAIWLNRDPLGEMNVFNLYNFVNGNPINRVDLLGLKELQFNAKSFKYTSLEGSTSDQYNCHSLAWHSGLGDPEDNAQWEGPPNYLRWDRTPLDDIEDAMELDPLASNIPGDILVYWTDINGDGIINNPHEISHSSLVVMVDSQGNTLMVVSKEGRGPITYHHPSNQNPYYPNSKKWYRKNCGCD